MRLPKENTLAQWDNLTLLGSSTLTKLTQPNTGVNRKEEWSMHI